MATVTALEAVVPTELLRTKVWYSKVGVGLRSVVATSHESTHLGVSALWHYNKKLLFSL